MQRRIRIAVLFLIVGLVMLLAAWMLNQLLAWLESVPEPAESAQPLTPEPVESAQKPLTRSFYADGNGWLRCENVKVVCGVDISEHQTKVDWNALYDAGARFVMLRVGYRGSTEGGLFEDAFFRSHVEAAQDAGLALGVYFFSQAVTAEEAEAEAEFVLEHIRGLNITWPVAFDWENTGAGTRTNGLSGRDMTSCALAFCRKIQDAGYRAAVYTNRNQWMLYEGYAGAQLEEYVIWMADYGTTLSEDDSFQLWQYTDAGMLPGVASTVDLNLSFTDYGAG